MIRERAMMLVAALRSGRYEQTTKTLTRLDLNGDVESHCCLGVACRVAISNGAEVDQAKDTRQHVMRYGMSKNIMPTSVIDWFGFKNAEGTAYVRNPSSADKDMRKYMRDTSRRKTEFCLMDMNDGGASFGEIADFIERHWRAL